MAYYKPSGKLTADAFVTASIIGVIAAIIVGFLYALANVYIPFAKLRILLPMLAGAGLGACVGLACMKAKVRNTPFKTTLALACGVIATYISWVAWVYLILRRDLPEGMAPKLVWDPLIIASFAHSILDTGMWSYGNDTPKGNFLLGIWAAEALFLIGGSAITAAFMNREVPFCETCELWVDEKQSVGPLMPVDQVQVKNLVESGNVSTLVDLQRSEAPEQAHTRIDLRACARCSNLYLLSAVGVSAAQKDSQRSEKTFIRNLVIDGDTYRRIMQKQNEAPAITA